MSCICPGGRSHISRRALIYDYAREPGTKAKGPPCYLAAAHHSFIPKYTHRLFLKHFLKLKTQLTLNFNILNTFCPRDVCCKIRALPGDDVKTISLFTIQESVTTLFTSLQIKHLCYLIYPDILGSRFRVFETTSSFKKT